MDPIGVTGFVIGIFSLYSACRDCYIFFTTVKSAEKESLVHLRELNIQHLKPVKGKPLQEIQDDVAELQVYGNALANIQAAATKIRQRLSVITKCRWTVKDRDDFKRLIADLKSYNDALYRLCPDGAFDAINVTLTLDYLSKQESLVGLRRTLTLTNELLRGDKMAPSRGGLEMLASAAALKTEIVKLRTSQALSEPEHTVEMIDPRNIKHLKQNLALWNGEIIYFERKSYRKIEEAGRARRTRRMPVQLRTTSSSSRSPSLARPPNSSWSAEGDDPPNHHPDKRASPKRMYRHAYDVYSLGIVLLEIGCWSRLESLREFPDDSAYDRQLRFPGDPYEFR
ncbi:MAG: hypothetical protein Q9165_007180 [Trypethelium subeluteriae]